MAGPNLAAAAPEPAAAPADPAPQNPEAIFRLGQAKYETADYAGALELWTQAYALVDSVPENATIKALLIYNLAQAHIKAYEFDDDPIHLRQAQQLLNSFEANLDMLYEDPVQHEEERVKIDERLAEIEAKIAARAEAEAEAKAAAEAKPEPPPPVIEPPVEPTDEDPRKPGTPLVISGSVVLGLGALFGLAAIVGGLVATNSNDISELDPNDLQAREDQFAAGQAGNAMGFVGTITGAVLIPTGIALIVVGSKRNKQAKRRTAGLPLLTPNVGRAGAGLTLSGRF